LLTTHVAIQLKKKEEKEKRREALEGIVKTKRITRK
jgi:hypothetical protein